MRLVPLLPGDLHHPQELSLSLKLAKLESSSSLSVAWLGSNKASIRSFCCSRAPIFVEDPWGFGPCPVCRKKGELAIQAASTDLGKGVCARILFQTSPSSAWELTSVLPSTKGRQS